MSIVRLLFGEGGLLAVISLSIVACSSDDTGGGVANPNDVKCQPGFANCDSNDANGCEVQLANNNAHCGACGNDCGFAACVDSICGPKVDLVSENVSWGVAVDTTYVYYHVLPKDSGIGAKGKLLRQGKNGGDPMTLVDQWPGISEIRLDSTHAYFASDGSLSRVALAGGASESFGGRCLGRACFGLTDSDIYYIGADPGTDKRALWRVPKGGGKAPVVLHYAPADDQQVNSVAVGPTGVYFVLQDGELYRLPFENASKEEQIAKGFNGDTMLMAGDLLLNGTLPSQGYGGLDPVYVYDLVNHKELSAINGAPPLASDGTSLYYTWQDESKATVVKKLLLSDIAGGKGLATTVTTANHLGALAVDSAHLYWVGTPFGTWVEAQGRGLFRTPK